MIRAALRIRAKDGPDILTILRLYSEPMASTKYTSNNAEKHWEISTSAAGEP